MSFAAVVLLYPLILSVLSIGAGLVVDALAGRVLHVFLIPVAGFGALVVISQFTVLSGITAPLTPWVLAAVAVCGFVLGRHSLRERWLSRRTGWWIGPAAGVAAYLTVGLPLIAAGRLTFPGYLLDTTAGFHLAAGEWMLHHGAGLPPPYPAYGAMLNAYYGNGYPSGGQVLLAASGWLSGQDLLWLYFPFQVFALALSALALASVAERAGLPRWAAAFTGWISAVPALVAAYAMMGSIKELTALPLLLVMGAAIVFAKEHARAGIRGGTPFAVAAAGAIGAIGPSAVAWIGLFGLTALAFALPVLRSTSRRFYRYATHASAVAASRTGAALAAVIVVLAIPTATRLVPSVNTALSFSGSNASRASDPGNLLRPLRFVQAFGVWLGESHRVDPKYMTETYALIGLAMALFVLGVFWLVRRRAWNVLAFVGGALIVWLVLDRRGTEWTSAKVMMLTSPVVLFVALIGAFGDLRNQRVQGALLAGILGAGVLASDALLYHGTSMAPTARFTELRSIGQRFAGQGPTLVPDFDEYTFYLLRNLNIDGPGFAARRPFALFGGGPLYGHSYDVDDIYSSFVQQFRVIVVRRSPRWSRPPGNFQLSWEGAYYDVWRRVAPAPALHLPIGTASEPVGYASCRELRSLARQAMKLGRGLRYATRPPDDVGDLATASLSGNVASTTDLDGLPAIAFGGPAKIITHVTVPVATRYRIWIGGAVDRPLHVTIDGHQVGAPQDQSGGDGNMIDVGSVSLSAGRHTIVLLRGGGGLAPGNNSGTIIDGVYLERVGSEGETVANVPAASWRSLCGRSLDWIEVP